MTTEARAKSVSAELEAPDGVKTAKRKTPSTAEPVTELRRIRIVECGEPLVDFLAHCPGLRLDHPRFQYRRETVLRKSVAEMLCAAEHALPKGYHLAIVEGWRPPYIQRRMYRTVWNSLRERRPELSDIAMTRLVNRYSAPMNPRVPPPHTTGGAVDLMLANEAGEPVDLTSPYGWDQHTGFSFDAPGLSEAARRHRDILAAALIPAGLTNYPSEFWHWSYGDQGWAYRGGHANAIYAAIQPPNWTPALEDDNDTPLTLIAMP